MRHFVSVHGGGEGAALPAAAGDILKQNALANLRAVRIESGFDYSGFEITGAVVPRDRNLDLPTALQHLELSAGEGAAANARVLLSPDPLPAGSPSGSRLVVSLRNGDAFSWDAGEGDFRATVTIDPERRITKFGAMAQDVFQDIMLANDACIQAVLSGFRAAGGDDEELFRRKAAFGRGRVDQGAAGSLFASFEARGYASFAALARRNLSQGMDQSERRLFVALWSDFITEGLADHLLTAEQATDLIRRGRYHSARSELTAGSGVRTGARILHEHVPRDELLKVLSAPMTVTRPGPYVLGLVNGRPGAAAGEVAARFGWRNQENQTPKRLALFTAGDYPDVVPLVRKGLVTPFRLFLKRQ
ncbi:hypothetical protein D9602_11860 [Sphingomonas sp. TX0522]|nr:hypothetical protein [Sphingomonas sp. TX0522]